MNRFLLLLEKYNLKQFEKELIYSVNNKLDQIVNKLIKKYKDTIKINNIINKLYSILKKYRFELRNIIKKINSIDNSILDLKVYILHQNYKKDMILKRSINDLINNPIYNHSMKYLLRIDYGSSYWLSNQLRAIFVSLIYILESLRDEIINKNKRLKTLYQIVPKRINEDIFKIISSFII